MAMAAFAATGCRGSGGGAARDGRAAAAPAVARAAAVEICVGAAHSCARAGDGTVACWGDNGNHAIALSDEAQIDSPRVVTVFPKATALRCAAESTCILDGTGAIHCLGGGETTVLRMPGAAPARDFVVNGYSICARDDGGRVVCWDGPPGTPPLEVAPPPARPPSRPRPTTRGGCA